MLEVGGKNSVLQHVGIDTIKISKVRLDKLFAASVVATNSSIEMERRNFARALANVLGHILIIGRVLDVGMLNMTVP